MSHAVFEIDLVGILYLHFLDLATLPIYHFCNMSTTAFKDMLAKTWKQPKCPSTDEWVKKMVYIYNETLTTQP